jgi:hypothetical protein
MEELMNEEDDNNEDCWICTPKRFFIETIVAIAIFLIIGAAAVGLSYIVKYLDSHGVDIVIVTGLKIVEYAIFVTDVVLFGRFLWKTGRRTWDEM